MPWTSPPARCAGALALVLSAADAGAQHTKQPIGGGQPNERLPSEGVPNGALYGLATVQLDFDGDGRRDVAVGAPGEGAVYVLFGPDHEQRRRIVPSATQPADRFGEALAAGPLAEGGGDELVIGSPHRSVNTLARAGAVWLVGHADEDPVRLQFPVEAGALLGTALVVGDFDADDELEVAAGAPLATVEGERAGAVHWLEPGGSAQTATNPAAHPFGNYGHDLAAADADGDGETDLFVSALGNPSADGIRSGGQVYVLLAPLPGGGSRVVEDPTRSAQDKIVRFGMSIHAADQDGDGKADLAVGAPRKDVGEVVDAGAVFLFRGPTFGADDALLLVREGASGSELLGFRVAIGNAFGGARPEVAGVALAERPGLLLWEGDQLAGEPRFRARPPDGSHHWGQGLSFGRPTTTGVQAILLGDPNFGKNVGRVDLLRLDRGKTVEATAPKRPLEAEPSDG